MENIKVYCVNCRDIILLTSDKFKIGGPYDGGMFKTFWNDSRSVGDFVFNAWATSGNLWCPRTEGHDFINGDGSLLTEHGLIREGQKTLDTEFSIIYHDPPLKNQLKWVDRWSKELILNGPPVLELHEDDELEKEWKERIIGVDLVVPGEDRTVIKRTFTCKKCGKQMDYGIEHKINGC